MSDDVWTPNNTGETKGEVKLPDPPEVTYPTYPTMALMPPHPFDLDKLKEYFQPYIVRLEGMVEQARDFKVVSAETNTTAIEMGSQMAKLKKGLEDVRKEVIAPYGDVVNGINGAVKPIKDLTDKAIKSLKGKIGAYNAEQAELARRIAQKKAEEEAAIRRKALEEERQKEIARQEKERQEAIDRKARLDAEAKAAGVEAVEVKIPEVVDPGIVEVVIEVPKDIASGIVRTAEGTSFTVKTWRFTVVSFQHVPEKYIIKSINEKMVKADIDAGVREIPGLEIYEHSDVRIRTK